MPEAWDDPEWLRHVFEETRVVRRPLTGIIAGYHTLPYILVGAEREQPGKSVEVRGRIRVSPRMVITPGRDGPTYGELFGERELMHHTLLARVFSFRYAPRLMLESEDLQVTLVPEGSEPSAPSTMKNISSGGVLFESDTPVALGRTVHILCRNRRETAARSTTSAPSNARSSEAWSSRSKGMVSTGSPSSARRSRCTSARTCRPFCTSWRTRLPPISPDAPVTAIMPPACAPAPNGR